MYACALLEGSNWVKEAKIKKSIERTESIESADNTSSLGPKVVLVETLLILVVSVHLARLAVNRS